MKRWGLKLEHTYGLFLEMTMTMINKKKGLQAGERDCSE